MNHYAATLARVHGVRFTIAVVHDTISTEVYEHSGVDVTINPRAVTAEEIVRFAHDPRTQQVAMLEGNRYEVLDITTQPTSEYVGLRFRDMPIRGALIGAIVRDGKALFPAQRRGPAGGGPRDRVHRAVAGARRREGAVSPDRAAARIGGRARSRDRPRRRARPDRDDARIPEPLRADPGLGRDRLRRAVLAVPRGGRDRRRHRASGLTRLGRRSPGPIGFREGYLVVSLTWLLAAVYAGLPVPPLGRASARRGRWMRSSRGCRASRRPAPRW